MKSARGRTREDQIRFPDDVKDKLESLFLKVSNLLEHDSFPDLGYEVTDGEFILTGLEKENIVFSHPNSARAFLDALMIGYDAGFGAGRRYTEE